MDRQARPIRNIYQLDKKGTSLKGLVFKHCHLENRDFTGYKFNYCRFTKCEFRLPLAQANFFGCHFTECSFRGQDLHETTFPLSELDGCRFDRSLIGPDTFRGAELYRCDFNGCNLPTTAQAIKAMQFETVTHEFEDGRSIFGIIAYRDEQGRFFERPPYWEFAPTKLLKETCDMDRWRSCGPGIHFTTLENCTSGQPWEMLIPLNGDICLPYFSNYGRAGCVILCNQVDNPFAKPVSDPASPF